MVVKTGSVEEAWIVFKAIAREHKTVASFIQKTQRMDKQDKIMYVETLLHEARKLVRSVAARKPPDMRPKATHGGSIPSGREKYTLRRQHYAILQTLGTNVPKSAIFGDLVRCAGNGENHACVFSAEAAFNRSRPRHTAYQSATPPDVLSRKDVRRATERP